MFTRAAIGGTISKVDRHAEELVLIKRIAAGEQHLYARIIDNYTNLVAGAIAAQGVDRGDVEDLAQQAFINAYKGIAGFRGEAKFSSWLYRIAINVARGHLKRLAKRPSQESIEEGLESGRQPVDVRRSGSEGEVVRSRALSGAMAALPVAQRTALSLYYFEELSYEEIAEAMEQNLNTVRTHIRRGKLRLAELLDVGVLDA